MVDLKWVKCLNSSQTKKVTSIQAILLRGTKIYPQLSETSKSSQNFQKLTRNYFRNKEMQVI